MASSLGYNVTMTLPATSRQTRAFDDRADALAHFFLRAGEAPRLLAYDDAVGCPLDQALAARAARAPRRLLVGAPRPAAPAAPPPPPAPPPAHTSARAAPASRPTPPRLPPPPPPPPSRPPCLVRRMSLDSPFFDRFIFT